MIVIETNTPLLPLTRMIGGDAQIEPGENVNAVIVDDDFDAYWISRTLKILGYEVSVQDVETA